jgi:hypothetical protein
MRTMQLTLMPDEIEGRFIEFHHANPHIYDTLVTLARRWRDAGHASCSIKMLFEVLRWQVGVSTHGDQFTLNNSYTSRYARLIAANERDLAGFFQMRTLKDGEHE